MLRSIRKRRPSGINIVVGSLIFLAIASIGGGSALLDDPSGRSMGIQFVISIMPFNLQDFFVVGLWLVIVYGVLPAILAGDFGLEGDGRGKEGLAWEQ